MADFYSDSHVSFDMLALLEAAGHTVVKSQAVGLRDAADHEHLWYATQERRTIITSDTGFAAWHRMWLYLARAWNVDVHHTGILIVPNNSRLGIDRVAQAIDNFVTNHHGMADGCFTLRVDESWQQLDDS